jgi:hypothetical protein
MLARALAYRAAGSNNPDWRAVLTAWLAEATGDADADAASSTPARTTATLRVAPIQHY